MSRYFTALFAVLIWSPAVLGCPIYLTVSLEGKSFEDSYIEINWGPECYEKPQWIGLFTNDPTTSFTHPEYRLADIKNTTGKVTTNVKIGKLRFPKGWNRFEHDTANIKGPVYAKGKCLPYYVASFTNNELLMVECITIHPTWMAESEHVARVPLKDLFIPGTHASGAYLTYTGKAKSALIRDYAVAQHFDVWSQLVFGIRYLDLSIGWFKDVDNYDSMNVDLSWIVNENVLINPLRIILQDVKRFLQATEEVVIIDFSSFPIGFYKHPQRHSQVLHLLRTELSELAYEHNMTVDNTQSCSHLSVHDIRSRGKSLLILYPIEELPYPENKATILCPSWKRFTAAFMNESQTLDYMRSLFSGKKNLSWIQDEGWIFMAIKSLEQALNMERLETSKQRAANINPRINTWLGGPWSRTANIVAIDYFTSTNIVDVAIYSNILKAFNMANKNYVNIEIEIN